MSKVYVDQYQNLAAGFRDSREARLVIVRFFFFFFFFFFFLAGGILLSQSLQQEGLFVVFQNAKKNTLVAPVHQTSFLQIT